MECAPDGDSALSDYGIAEWKGRVLEAGFAEARLRMQHRDRGEYQDNCYVFGYVLDKEFDRARDAVVVKCNEQAAIERYKLGQRFSSRWIAEALPPSGAGDPGRTTGPETSCRAFASTDWRRRTMASPSFSGGGDPCEEGPSLPRSLRLSPRAGLIRGPQSTPFPPEGCGPARHGARIRASGNHVPRTVTRPARI